MAGIHAEIDRLEREGVRFSIAAGTDGFVARAQRNGDRRTSFVSLTRKGRAAFAQMAAAHECWIDELLGGVSARDAEQLSAKLKSFRSDWEGGA